MLRNGGSGALRLAPCQFDHHSAGAISMRPGNSNQHRNPNAPPLRVIECNWRNQRLAPSHAQLSVRARLRCSSRASLPLTPQAGTPTATIGMRPATSLRTKTKLVNTTPSGCRASWVLLRVQCCPRPYRPEDALSKKSVREHFQVGRAARRWQSPGRRSLAAVPVSGCCVLFPARFVAGAVVACVRLSSSVPSSSPVVAAVRLALARSQRLAALAPHIARPFTSKIGAPRCLSPPPRF